MIPHSIASPSSADRWVKCTGSLALIKSFPPPYVTSEALERGTRLHNLARECFASNDPKGLQQHFITTSNEEGVEAFKYYEYVLDLYHSEREAGNEVKLYVEQRVSLTDILPDMHGTPDAVLTSGDTLHIIDLKTGRMRVNAVDNAQLMLYAYGSMMTYKLSPRSIKLHIYQNNEASGDNTHYYDCSLIKLNEFIECVKSLLGLYQKGIMKYRLGAHCIYCPVAYVCPSRHLKIMDVFQTLGEVHQTPDNMYSLSELINMYSIYKDLAPFMETIKQKLLDKQPEELGLHNVQIKTKLSPQQYSDKDKALQALKEQDAPLDDVAPRTLLSPAQLKKKAKRYYEAVEPYLEPQKESKYLKFIENDLPSVYHD